MSGYSSGIRQKSDPSLYYSFSFNYFVIHHSAGCAGAAHKVASYIILKFPQSPVKKSAPTSANYHLLCLCTTPWQHQVDRIISPTLCVCSILPSPQHTSSPSTNNCIQAAWGYYLNVSPAPSVDITRAVNEISIKIAKCFTFSLTPWLYISDLIIVNLYHGQTSPILIESCLTIHQQVITHLLPYSSPPYRPPSFVVYLVVRSTFICLVW